MTKEEKCKLMNECFGWNYEDLMKRNDSQIHTLFGYCLDDNGNPPTPKEK